jgi:hypothetical protein
MVARALFFLSEASTSLGPPQRTRWVLLETGVKVSAGRRVVVGTGLPTPAAITLHP